MYWLWSLCFALALTALPSFASAQTLRVGPGEMYTTIGAAATAATDGATIEIAAGTYREEVVWSANGLTIRGVGRVIMDLTGMTLTRQGGKGIFIVDGDDITIEGIEFVGAHVADDNGSGIRWQGGGTLTVRDCVFRDNENGILGGNHADANAVIEGCEFIGNGRGDYGYTHNLYINEIDTLTFRGNWSHALVSGTPDVGHLLKSRARRNIIMYNRLTGEDSHSSYEIQLTGGGQSYIIGNIIEQGSMGPNRTVISLGGDGTQWPGSHVFVFNNTIVNSDTRGTFINATAAIMLDVVNNLFIGPGMMIGGGMVTRMETNLMADASVLVGAASYDYRLVAGSAPIDAGSPPGSDGAMSLVPMFQYVHPRSMEPRGVVGTIDVGAYEFGSVPVADGGTSGGDGGGLPGSDGGGVVIDSDGSVAGGDGGAAMARDGGPGDGSVTGGCCRVGTRGPSGGALAGLLVLAMLVWRRRRG